MKPLGRVVLRSACTAVAAGVAVPLPAQESALRPPPLEHIVVTATRRPENLQDVPVSVSVVAGARLDDFALNRLEEAATLVPGLIVGKSVVSDYLYIRGIGSGNLDLFEQSVATYVDGVYFGRGRTARNPLLDVERLEVLKGPQGVLFGKNTIGGVINITDRKPTQTFEGSYGLSWDPEHDAYRLDGVVSGPLSDRLSGRLAAQLGTSKGYVHNTNIGDDEPAIDEWIARGILTLRPHETLQLSLKLEGGRYDVTGQSHQIALASPALAALSLAIDPRAEFDLDFTKSSLASDGSLFSRETYDVELSTAALTLHWDLPRHALIGTSSLHEYDLHSLGEGDFSPIDLLAVGFDERYEALAQDLRIESDLGARFDYLAGIYIAREELGRGNLAAHFDFSSVLPVAAAFTSHVANTFETEHFSAYAQARFAINRQWTVSAGLRYTTEDKTGTHTLLYSELGGMTADPVAEATAAAFLFPPANALPRLERHSEDVSASVSVEYSPSDELLAYARFAEGFKAGGFGGFGEPFDDESADSYELGVKARLSDGRVTVAAAWFDTQIDGLQVSSFDPQTTAFIVQNAATASTQGIEIETRWRASRGLTLGLAAASIDARYDRFPTGTCPFVPADPRPFCDLSGERLQYAPRRSGNLTLEWQRPVRNGWEFRGLLELQASDEYFTAADADPRSRQHGYAKLNAGGFLSSADGRYRFALIGRNLTDRVTSTFIDDVPLGELLGASFLGRADPPRTLTLQFRAAY